MPVKILVWVCPGQIMQDTHHMIDINNRIYRSDRAQGIRDLGNRHDFGAITEKFMILVEQNLTAILTGASKASRAALNECIW